MTKLTYIKKAGLATIDGRAPVVGDVVWIGKLKCPVQISEVIDGYKFCFIMERGYGEYVVCARHFATCDDNVRADILAIWPAGKSKADAADQRARDIACDDADNAVYHGGTSY